MAPRRKGWNLCQGSAWDVIMQYESDRGDLLDSYGMRLQKLAIPLQLEKYQVTVEGRFSLGRGERDVSEPALALLLETEGTNDKDLPRSM